MKSHRPFNPKPSLNSQIILGARRCSAPFWTLNSRFSFAMTLVAVWALSTLNLFLPSPSYAYSANRFWTCMKCWTLIGSRGSVGENIRRALNNWKCNVRERGAWPSSRRGEAWGAHLEDGQQSYDFQNKWRAGGSENTEQNFVRENWMYQCPEAREHRFTELLHSLSGLSL